MTLLIQKEEGGRSRERRWRRHGHHGASHSSVSGEVIYPRSWYPHPSIYISLDVSNPVGCRQKRQCFKGTRSALESLNMFPGLTDETSLAERAMNENGLCVPQWYGTAHLFFGHWGQSVPFCASGSRDVLCFLYSLKLWLSSHLHISLTRLTVFISPRSCSNPQSVNLKVL